VTFTPKTLSEALDILNSERTIPFAGGTDLMVRRRSWSGTNPNFEYPALFIGELKELKEIHINNNMLEIGAAAPLADLLEHPEVPEILKQAIRVMASPAIRNLATLGGNICNSSPAADTLPPLTVLGATVVLQSKSSRREVSVSEFIKGPGQNDLKENELLSSIHLSMEKYNYRYYKKVGTRKADALSKVSFAGLARTSGGIVDEVKIAIGAVAPRIVTSPQAEKLMKGKPIQDLVLRWPEIRQMYQESIRPIDDQRSTAAYRNEVASRLIEYFITQLK
jgi:CO/xanthine dehydrogenase FAD-binding subunit